ncbi:hypothetical protein [Runella limosa]|uniref:hypothetical protein n=1 Tax=Runella limosa TaxID=370978 RepID=UPI0003FF2DC8|nr:hypothetical protein [Runella limosa]
MRKVLLLALLCLTSSAYAQLSLTDTLLVDIKDSLQSPVLLPQKMIFTQKMLWGHHGLMRHWMPLNRQNRQQEFKIRRTMFNIHQAAGLLTFAGMVAQGVVGGKMYKNYSDDLRAAHRALAKGVNIGYTLTATMALTAPSAIVHRRGLSSAKVHRMLAMVHLLGMIGTNVLGHQISKNPELKPYHRAVAYTTVGAFTASILVFQFR